MKRLSTLKLLPCLCTILVGVADAQVPDSLPPGWGKSGNKPDDYSVALDNTVHRSGRASGVLRSHATAAAGTGAGTATGVLAQGLRADSLHGARIRVSAWLRTRDVQAVRFFVRVDGPDGSVQDFANADGDPVTGTAEWKQRDIIVDVPADALGVTFGFVVQGAGTIWIDDVAVAAVPKATPRTGVAPTRGAPSAEMERTLRARFAPRPTKAQNLGFEDPLKLP